MRDRLLRLDAGGARWSCACCRAGRPRRSRARRASLTARPDMRGAQRRRRRLPREQRGAALAALAVPPAFAASTSRVDDAAVRTRAADRGRGRCPLPWRAGAPAARRRRGWRRGRRPEPAASARRLAAALRGGRRLLRRRCLPSVAAGPSAAGSLCRRAQAVRRFGGCGERRRRLLLPPPPTAFASSPSAAITRDELVDRHILRAFRHHDLGEHAFVDGLDFHGRLVGLDLGDHVAGLDGRPPSSAIWRDCPSPWWATARA